MITEQTKITPTDFKTLGLTIFAVAISVWAYFGIVERLNRLETADTLFETRFLEHQNNYQKSRARANLCYLSISLQVEKLQ